MHFLLFILLGFALGAVGTLVGAGGGFLLVPILLLMYPHEEPETITAISLTVIAANAISGSIGYWRRKRIDVRSALVFALAATPGSVLGVLVAARLPPSTFQLILGIALLALSIFLLKRPIERTAAIAEIVPPQSAWGPRIPHSRVKGIAIAAATGFCSGLLGIGGGIIHVPMLVHVLGFPVHIATATSHLVLAITAIGGVLTHVANGSFAAGLDRAIPLSLGVIVGAQLGAALAPRVPASIIMRLLAVALLGVGIRVLILGISSQQAASAVPRPTDPAQIAPPPK